MLVCHFPHVTWPAWLLSDRLAPRYLCLFCSAELQNWTLLRCGLMRVEQQGIITSLDLLATLFFYSSLSSLLWFILNLSTRIPRCFFSDWPSKSPPSPVLLEFLHPRCKTLHLPFWTCWGFCHAVEVPLIGSATPSLCWQPSTPHLPPAWCHPEPWWRFTPSHHSDC